jgi:hypothetical protein
MSGSHVGFEFFSQGLCQYHRVQEDGRLGYFGLTKIFVGAGKHQVGNPKAQYFVRLLEKIFR